MTQGSGVGFISGFIGGGLLSGLVLSAVSVAVPLTSAAPPADPAPVEQAEQQVTAAPRLEVTSQSPSDQPVTQTTTARPSASSLPSALNSAPAVDPEIAGNDIALTPVEDVDEAIISRSTTPRPSAPSTVEDPMRSGVLAAPEDTQVAGLNTEDTARVRPAARQPSGGLSAPGLDTDNATSPSLPASGLNTPPAQPTPDLITSRATELTREEVPVVDSAPPPPPPFELPDVAPVTERVSDAMRPVRMNAAQFQDDGSRPLLSVVLIDEGTNADIVAALTSVSLPVTFALPVDMTGVQERAQTYRDAGFEVVALIPETLAEDLAALEETALDQRIASILAAVPGAVGLMDYEGGVLTSNAGVGAAAVDYLALSGHALLVYPRMGLTQLDDVAMEQGVPSIAVSDDVSGADGALAMAAGLRSSALEARTSQSAVMVGQVNDTMLTTMVTWALTTENRSVSLAPLTAVMNRVTP